MVPLFVVELEKKKWLIKKVPSFLKFLVGDARFELAASGFGGQHSIQLS
jgi:hypothetical protein